MPYRCPYQVLVCAALVMLSACVNQPNALELAKNSQCHDDITLENNHQRLVEIQEHYCTAVLSNLAPPAPKGVQPQWTRKNPYPALPDYYLFPDTSPMQINGKRLQKVASCMHKRCVQLTQKPQSYCGEPGCVPNKGHSIISIFLDLSQTCTAEPYTRRRVVENIRKIYNERESKPVQLCKQTERLKNIDLKLAFHEKVDACLPGQNQCPVNYICTPEKIGHRCRTLKPLPAPNIPGIVFPTTQKRQPLGTPCQLSSECHDDLVCGSAAGAYAVCALPCSDAVLCPKLHHCHQGPESLSFCTESCDPTSEKNRASLSDNPRTCIPDKNGGRYIDLTKAQLRQLVPPKAIEGHKNPDGMGRETGIENLLQACDTTPTCGNGILEPPEQCDLGKSNGQVKLGAWCTTSCTTAECGNNIREPGEACECTIDYERAFAKSIEMNQLYQLPTTCPGRHAITDGSEKALGFACHTCAVVHGRHMRDTRQNPYFLPEFDPFNPPDDNGEMSPKLPE
ncbi:MAG: hypothetical protein HOI23_19195 [Deltaproteobacteria bacterium]|jgi:hypothetical protein|nr:hypothetical protein [Deltaproteobacteria bacterium]MBT6434806.1 hypothetical protein [Deltaproteobacteria bacterium]MBT6492259.1 hypothetical protein [Deltaproteobacteria bacterium]